ncbi:MAG: ASPIC/UnbV domain-containing protein, partial [Myxococcota bacterium]
LDLVMTNGIDLPELVGEEAFHDDPMRAWCNQGDRFIECSDALALTDRGLGAGLLATDLDDDGDDDLIVVNTGGRPVVYENQTDGHWLQVIARGVESNRDGVGVIVSLRAREEGAAQVRVVGSGAHFLAHAPFVASFGLGSDLERVHELRVRWPQGTERIFRDVPVDQRLVVMEREDGAHVPRSDAWKPTDGCSSAGPLTGLWALTVLGLGKSLSRRRTRGR